MWDTCHLSRLLVIQSVTRIELWLVCGCDLLWKSDCGFVITNTYIYCIAFRILFIWIIKNYENTNHGWWTFMVIAFWQIYTSLTDFSESWVNESILWISWMWCCVVSWRLLLWFLIKYMEFQTSWRNFVVSDKNCKKIRLWFVLYCV